MSAYYNEIDRYCCDWLQNLMDAGHITPGRIDDRSIADLSPDDVRGYERVHFFAGIAGWELALSLSGYAGPVCWTGSCPCQPFSAAGKGKASGDERHLWPEWFRLISAVRPPIIFGEQVEAAIGWGWLDLVHSDLEAEGYTVGAAVLPACSVGAPHIRQRLWFMANTESCDGEISILGRGPQQASPQSRRSSRVGELAESSSNGRQNPRNIGGLAQAARHAWPASQRPHGSPWSNLIWLPCTDGKQRPTGFVEHPEGHGRGERGAEPSGGSLASGCSDHGQGSTQSIIQPLAHGVSGRVAKLRAAGNAIVPQVAAEFIKAVMP